jgi:putative inorganic carbon (HCO3(-)) transporter
VVGLLIVAQLLVATKDPHTRRLVFLGVSGVLVIGALLGTYTRGSWIGFGAGLILLLRKRWALLLGAGIVGFLLLALGPPDARDRILSIADPSHPRNVERVLIWEHGMDLVQRYPWTGVGLEIPAELMQRERTTESGAVIRVHSHMHNAYLQIAVSMGLPALLVFLWMIVAYLRMGGRAPLGGIHNLWEEGLVAAYVPMVVALLVNGFFEWNFGDSEVLGLFYLLSGCVLGVESGRRT